MRINFQTPPVNMSAIWLTLLLFVLCLGLAGCAATPRLIAVECPKFPPPPAITLPPVGSFRLQLNSILAPH